MSPLSLISPEAVIFPLNIRLLPPCTPNLTKLFAPPSVNKRKGSPPAVLKCKP